MRCFENHQVVDFDEIRKSALEPSEPVPIHKPIFCAAHANEKLKFYCFACEVSGRVLLAATSNIPFVDHD